MKIIFNKNENHMKYLTIELDAIETNEYIEKVQHSILKDKVVSGCKNKCTHEDAMEKNVDRNECIDHVIKEIIPDICSQVIREHKIETKMQPLIRTIKLDPIIFEMVIPLKPVVNLCDYHNIKLEPESLDIKKEEIDFVLKGLQSQFASYNVVNRDVMEGDIISVDIECTTAESNVINQRAVQLRIDKEYFSDIPNLYDQIIGMEKNELKEFSLILPENYPTKAMAAKEVKFKVKINDIKEIVLPQIDDEFAKKVALGVDTLDKLIDRIEKNIKRERKNKGKNRFECRLMDQIIKMSEIEYPSIMVDMEMEGLINQYKEELKSNAQDYEEYREEIKQLSGVKVKYDLRPIAEQRILWSLIINEVANIENIDVSYEEVDEEIEKMINEASISEEQHGEMLNDYRIRQNVYDIVKARKTIDRLTEIVQDNN